MLLREINFNNVKKQGFIGLVIRQNNKTIAEGFIGEVLRKIPYLAEHNVLNQRPYFNEWVIEID